MEKTSQILVARFTNKTESNNPIITELRIDLEKCQIDIFQKVIGLQHGTVLLRDLITIQPGDFKPFMEALHKSYIELAKTQGYAAN